MSTPKLLVGSFILLLLAGCTAQLGYRYADTLIEWRLSDYVSLTDQQSELVSAKIDELHLWHATTELPKYRRLLQNVRQQISTQSLSYNDIDVIENKLWQLWSNIQQRLVKEAHLAAELSMSQRAELLDNMQEKLNEDYEEQQQLAEQSEFVRLIERGAKREERLQEWFGEVTKPQQQLLRQWLQEQPSGNHWLDYRQQWLDTLSTALLKNPIDLPVINQLVVEPQNLRTEQHIAYTEQRTAVRHKYLFKLYQSMSEQQRQYLLAEIDEYLSLLDDLIEDFS